MRNLKFIKCLKLTAFLSIILVIVCLSCEKDDEDNSGYYGRWMTEKAVPASTGIINVNYYLTLSNKNRFIESFDIYTRSLYSNWENVSIEGSVLVLENHMQFNVEKISFFNYDSQKNRIEPAYSIITNSQDIEPMLSGLIKITSGYNTEFSLDGNKLTFSVDYDENGNYSDYETLTYTRQ